nr:deoxyribodipyrimidine photo-lyase [Stagnihabitans tardus]
MTNAPLLLWFRRDLRVTDLPMLSEALATGRPVMPVFILDPETESIGAAALWRLGLGVEAFAATLERMGSRLILRRGPALDVLERLIAETGAAGVFWSRSYDPATRPRDEAVKAGLKARGLLAQSFPGFLLHEPWEIETGQGGFFKVYTPFWRVASKRPVPPSLAAPAFLPEPPAWPQSDRLQDWNLGARMRRGAAVMAPHQRVGEAKALARLEEFIGQRIGAYGEARDMMAEDATSGLSENLTYGEISPRRIWHAGYRALEEGQAGAEQFLKELVWREFAWALLHHTPHIAQSNWKPDWDGFPWGMESDKAEAWRRGMTGEPVIDAAMRQLYVTGKMHNRARMLVGSYLTKHLMTHWKIGLDWFADTLTDWDPAANAMGWQWVAGSGPDAAPYFRIFNPATQAEKFDPAKTYRRRWLAEFSRDPLALSYFDAVPKSWALDPARPYPRPIVSLEAGRALALASYAQRKA